VRPRPDISGMNPPYVFYGVSLCCGENCSSRVSAGMMAAPWAWNETGYSFTAIPIYQLSPDFPQRQVPQEHNFCELQSSLRVSSGTWLIMLPGVSLNLQTSIVRTHFGHVSPSSRPLEHTCE
jgi:hypothetical protein